MTRFTKITIASVITGVVIGIFIWWMLDQLFGNFWMSVGIAVVMGMVYTGMSSFVYSEG